MNSGSKTEADSAAGNLGNDQLIGDGGNIIGTTSQGNRQGDLVGQTLLGGKVDGTVLGNCQTVGDNSSSRLIFP